MELKRGDFIFYYVSNYLEHPIASVIDFGEYIQEKTSPSGHWYHHVGLSLGNKSTYEADSFEKVGSYPIKYPTYDIIRPNVSSDKIENAISFIQHFNGESYGWVLDLNDALEMVSDNHIHLPEKWIEETEKNTKICSTLQTIAAIKMGVLKAETDNIIDITTPQSLFNELYKKIGTFYEG